MPDTKSRCSRRLFGGPLQCTREPDHTPGCIFVASDAPDRHVEPNGHADQ